MTGRFCRARQHIYTFLCSPQQVAKPEVKKRRKKDSDIVSYFPRTERTGAQVRGRVRIRGE